MNAITFGCLRLQDGVKRLSKRILALAGRLIAAHPQVKRFCITVASRFKLTVGLSHLYRLTQTASNRFQHGWPDAPHTRKELSSQARQVYADLSQAIRSQQQEHR